MTLNEWVDDSEWMGGWLLNEWVDDFEWMSGWLWMDGWVTLSGYVGENLACITPNQPFFQVMKLIGAWFIPFFVVWEKRFLHELSKGHVLPVYGRQAHMFNRMWLRGKKRRPNRFRCDCCWLNCFPAGAACDFDYTGLVLIHGICLVSLGRHCEKMILVQLLGLPEFRNLNWPLHWDISLIKYFPSGRPWMRPIILQIHLPAFVLSFFRLWSSLYSMIIVKFEHQSRVSLVEADRCFQLSWPEISVWLIDWLANILHLPN